MHYHIQFKIYDISSHSNLWLLPNICEQLNLKLKLTPSSANYLLWQLVSRRIHLIFDLNHEITDMGKGERAYKVLILILQFALLYFHWLKGQK